MTDNFDEEEPLDVKIFRQEIEKIKFRKKMIIDRELEKFKEKYSIFWGPRLEKILQDMLTNYNYYIK